MATAYAVSASPEHLLAFGDTVGRVEPSSSLSVSPTIWGTQLGMPGWVAGYTATGAVTVVPMSMKDAVLQTYHAESDPRVREYLEAQAHLVERLECFRRQVRSLWGDGVAAALELTLEDSPSAGSPTLVVWAFADLAPEEDAEGTSALFRGQYDRFGPWPSGIGFALVIRDAAEVR